MSDLVGRIDEIIERYSLLKHPFYQKWTEGRLEKESLAGYSKEYYQLVKAVPEFMTPVMRGAPQAVLPELEENRREESEHVALWKRFAALLGVTGTDLAGYAGLDTTRRAVSDLSYLMHGYGAGSSAMYAFEKEIPRISKTKLDGLEEFYGISCNDQGVEYFRIHMEADVRHAASWEKILDSCGEPEDILLESATRSMQAQNLLLDGCHDEYC